ncbi:hypothetical protein RLEG12_01055 (plasmid) [Rhizobium leguminosarum bv. trifolii CB782]|nr:hypothetical protein RLEG12_01055 [Rhizobium leguminosarum bv. trifolii CB782]
MIVPVSKPMPMRQLRSTVYVDTTLPHVGIYVKNTYKPMTGVASLGQWVLLVLATAPAIENEERVHARRQGRRLYRRA